VIGGWRKLHNEELHNLYGSPSIIRNIKSGRMRWTGRVACMGRMGMHVGFWWGKPDGKGPLGRPRDMWEDNIRMDLRGVGWGWYGLD
jgi:hypothetical protein